MSRTMPTPSMVTARPLGAWVCLWHVVAAFVAMVASYWALKTEAVATLLELAVDKAYFDGRNPLLLDSYVRGYSADLVRDHLTALGNAASFYYADTYLTLYDLVFPLLVMAFAVLFILYATQPGQRHALQVTPAVRRFMLALAIALFAADICENLAIRTLLEMQPAVNAKLVETASMFTQLKWLVAFVLGAILTGLVAFTGHKLIEGDHGAMT